MKWFSKKSLVACVLLSILLFGFFSVIPVAMAQSVEQAITSTSSTSGVDYNLISPNSPEAQSWWKTSLDVVGGLFTAGPFTVIASAIALIGLILNLILVLAAGLFDIAMHLSVFNISNLLATGGPIDVIWAFFRDFINMFFIFMLLWLAISKILNTWGVKAKAEFIQIILSAIFINFSLFFTKVLIDIGNIFAVAFYNNILQTIGDPSGTSTSIAGAITNHLGLINFFSVSIFGSFTNQVNTLGTMVLQVVLVGILIWTFFYAAFMFIGRTVMLMLLAATSPVMFIGGAIPWLEEQRKDWWSEFTGQVMVAPLFLLLMMLVLRLMYDNTIQSALAATISSDQPALNIGGFMFYFIVMYLLIKGMKKVKDLSGEVGKVATKIGTSALVLGAAAVTGGATLGATALSAEAGEAAAAASATNGRLAGMRARLGFAGEKTWSATKKVVSGDISKEPGYLAAALTKGRGSVMDAVKAGTGDFVDIPKMQKAFEKADKENIENIMKKAEAEGPQKARDAKKELETTQENIKGLAKERVESKDEGKTHEAAKKELEESKKKVTELEGDATAKIPEADGKSKLDKAKEAVTASENKVKEALENMSKAQEEEEKKIAQEMGTSLDDIKAGIEKADTDIAKGVVKRNAYINKIASKGSLAGAMYFGILKSKKDRDKIIAKVRAQKGKYDPKDKNKVLENVKEALGITDEKKEGGEKKEGESAGKDKK